VAMRLHDVIPRADEPSDDSREEICVFIVVALPDPIPADWIRIEPARIRSVVRIVHRECVRIRRRCCARNEEWVAAQEPSDDWVVEPRAETDEAEGRQRIATVPLIGRVADHPRLRAGGLRLAIRLVLEVLHEVARGIRGETVATRFAERKDPWPGGS